MLIHQTKWARRFEAVGLSTAALAFVGQAWPVAVVSGACFPAMLIAAKLEERAARKRAVQEFAREIADTIREVKRIAAIRKGGA